MQLGSSKTHTWLRNLDIIRGVNFIWRERGREGERVREKEKDRDKSIHMQEKEGQKKKAKRQIIGNLQQHYKYRKTMGDGE